MSSQGLPLPLSLQDTCLLHILFRLEEFPVETLALLPLAFRHKLFLSLSQADILHLSSTALFKDLEVSTLSSAYSDAHRTLIFGNEHSLVTRHHSACFLTVNLGNALAYFDELDEYNIKHDLLKHIRESYPSFEPIGECFPSCDPIVRPCTAWDNVNLIFPSRSFRFASLSRYPDFVLVEPLPGVLQYCNVHTGPETLTINCWACSCDDCSVTIDTFFLREYLKQKKDQQLASSSAKKMEPIVPFVQELLSGVEVLELGTRCKNECDYNFSSFDIARSLSYDLLYNIVTSKQPRLKHLKVSGDVQDVIHAVLSSVDELLCCGNTAESHVSCGSMEVATPVLAPYSLERLSVSVPLYIPSTVKSIITFQLHSLKSVDIRRDPHVRNYECRDLHSSLTQLLKQPQFHSLVVDGYPLPETYELIETFLCTPATHEQTLVVIVDGIDDIVIDMDAHDEEANRTEGRPPLHVPQHLPETNVQFKRLQLEISPRCVYTWLFSQLELKLKRLMLEVLYDIRIHADIQVEQVVIEYCNPDVHEFLEKLIIFNTALKRLKLYDLHGLMSVLPTLNHCLSTLNQQGRALEKLQISIAYFDFTDKSVKEFFAHVRDLSQRCGTALVLSDCVFSPEIEMCLPLLSEEFQGKKIKRIICKISRDSDSDSRPSLLGLIADEFIVRIQD